MAPIFIDEESRVGEGDQTTAIYLDRGSGEETVVAVYVDRGNGEELVWAADPDSINATVTEDGAIADGSDENEYTVTLERNGSGESGWTVDLQGWGYPSGANPDISPSETTTDYRGEATFTATMDEPGDLDITFVHPRTGLTASAESTFEVDAIIVDDFEHGNLDAYYSEGDYSDPDDFSLSTSWSNTGTYSLYNNNGLSRLASYPDGSSWQSSQWNELNYYPDRGDTLEYYVHIDGDTDVDPDYRTWVRVAQSGVSNAVGHYIQFDSIPPSHLIYDSWDDDYETDVQDIGSYFSGGSTFRCEFEWGDNDWFYGRVYDADTGEQLGNETAGYANASTQDRGVEWALLDDTGQGIHIDDIRVIEQ